MTNYAQGFVPLIRLYERKIDWGAIIAVAMILAVIFSVPTYSQSTGDGIGIPSKTAEVVESLNDAEWENLSDGLRSIRVVTPQGLVLNAFGISPEFYDFEVGLQAEKTGEWAKDVLEREGALIAANAGFFAEKTSGELYSVGFLQMDGKIRSRAWKNSGGFIQFGADGLELSPSSNGIPVGEADILQTKPMMIEPGGVWAMRSNRGEVKHRSILCKMDSGEVILATITRGGLSVFEAGWIMRAEADGGYFNCDSAVALDGGRSTQVWYSERPEMSFPGLTPVHNFLLVKPKSE